MKNTNLEIINLAKDADGYIVTIEATREVEKDTLDIMVERQSTHTNFTSYDTAIEYFHQNSFRLEALVNTMEKGWTENASYNAEMRLLAFNINDMNSDPSMEDYLCAVFTADYEEDK